MSEKRIGIVIAYFGPWPEWMPLFLESCRWNPTVDWILYGDHELPGAVPPNVRRIPATFAQYQQRVSERLGVPVRWTDTYKLHEVKPMIGVLHAEELAGCDYFGWSDVDVIYGRIRAIYDDTVLSNLVVSPHADRVAGHFTLIRNSPEGRELFRAAPDWREHVVAPDYRGFEEYAFSRLFLGPHPGHRWRVRLAAPWRPRWWRSQFREQYSTPFNSRPWRDGTWNHPREWYWREGRLTNDRDGEREFLYLHFMNYKGARYRCPRFGPTAPWPGLPRLVQISPREAATGFRIGDDGFTALPRR